MAAEHSYGTKLEYAADAIFTAAVEVPNVRSIDPEDVSVTKTMTHHLRSLNAIKTRIAGMIEYGDLVCEVIYDETSYDLLNVIMLSRTEKFWRVTMPGGSTLTGPGFISMLGVPRAPDDDVISNTLRVSPSGGWTFTKVPP
jgi:hypothetical protein